MEEVDRDRQRKDDSQRHMEGAQRQTCMEDWIGTDTADKVDIRTVAKDDKLLMDINLSLNLLKTRHNESFSV